MRLFVIHYSNVVWFCIGFAISNFFVVKENLPEHADVDWVRGKFSAFGPVQYVSLPRYKSLKIKGFAFVEFGDTDAITRAIQVNETWFIRQTILATLIFSKTSSFALFQQYFNPSSSNPTTDAFAKEAALPVVPSVTIGDFDEEDLSAQHGHKRKREEAMAEDEDAVKSTMAEPSSTSTAASSSVGVKKLPPSNADSTVKAAHVALSPELLPLKVISKVEWLVLRKRYLELQKESYQALKEVL